MVRTAPPVPSVVKVPSSPVLFLYLHSPTVVLSRVTLSGRAASVHLPPRISNLSSLLPVRHQGRPPSTPVVYLRLPNDDVQRASAAVPVVVALSTLIPMSVPELVTRGPVVRAVTHSKSVTPPESLKRVIPMFVIVTLVPVASEVPVGCVSTGEAGEATGTTAAAMSATAQRRMVFSFFKGINPLSIQQRANKKP